MIQDGVNGLLVPEHDSKSLAEKIIYLVEHPSRATSLGKSGRETIEKQFELQTINFELDCLIKKIAEATFPPK